MYFFCHTSLSNFTDMKGPAYSYLEVLRLSFWCRKVLTCGIGVSPVLRQFSDTPAPRRQAGLVSKTDVSPVCALSIAQMIQGDDFQTMPMEAPVCGVAASILEVALITIAKTSLFILIACM